jgi:hypothetical protein
MAVKTYQVLSNSFGFCEKHVDHRSRFSIFGGISVYALVAVIGCSDGGPAGVVRGTVTLDGQPLQEGTIQLAAVDGQAPTAGAQVIDGKFETRAAPAKYRVKIESNIVLGKDGKKIETGQKLDKYAPQSQFTISQLVPDKYNTNSELELDVQSGVNEPRFDLTSK